MPEFIAMLGSAPGPKSLGQVPQQRIPNFSVASIANRGNLQGIPDFSVQSIANRGNLRGLGQTQMTLATGVASGIKSNLFTGAAASSGSAGSSADATMNRTTCKAVIPLTAFIQLTNDRISAWSKFRDYSGQMFPINFIPQSELSNDLDKRWFRDFTQPRHGAGRYAPPVPAERIAELASLRKDTSNVVTMLDFCNRRWDSQASKDRCASENGVTDWINKYRSFGNDAAGHAFRWYEASKMNPARVTGPYKLEDEILAYASGYLAKEVVEFYKLSKSRYDANPELFKNELVARFLLQPTDDPTRPNYAESIVLRAAAAYIAASIPGTIKSITDNVDSAARYADPAAVVGATDPSREDRLPYLNTIIDRIASWKNSVSGADPIAASTIVAGIPELTSRIAAAGTVIAAYINNWTNVRGLPSVTLNMNQMIVDALPDDIYRVLCSFDPNLYIDPTKRTPSYILTSDAATQKARAITDAIAAAQLVTVPEERRLYSFSQLQAAKEAAKQAAFSNCTLSAMDMAEIDKRVEDAISTRRLQTPAEVEAAVEKAKDDIQKLVDAAEGKYNAYLVQDAKDDAAAKNAADKAVADAQKAVVEAEKAGTNKMLIAVGAVAAVAVLAMIVMRKKE